MIQNNSYDADTLHEECGVFGMYDFDGADVASTIYWTVCPAAPWPGELRYCSQRYQRS